VTDRHEVNRVAVDTVHDAEAVEEAFAQRWIVELQNEPRSGFSGMIAMTRCAKMREYSGEVRSR
jgi:hypothetical protein